MVSIILPSYNEEKMIKIAADTIGKLFTKENIEYELIFVDDGSKDKTWQQIEEVSENDAHVIGVHFSRNFGKEAAMFAGLEAANGDCCVVMDCDLQHPPETAVEMYRLWEQGYEVVEGVKSDRGKESAIHKLAANTFYGIMSKTSGFNMADASDFKLLDRKVVDALNNMKERNVFFRALSHWAGFKKISVSYEVQERIEGQSKWSTTSLIKYAIRNITSFSTGPMQIVTVLGAIMMVISVVLGTITLIQKFTGQSLEGFSTVITVQLFSSSIIMISLGIIGVYISKIYEEVKGRPRYIVSKKVGDKKDDK